MTPKPLLGDMAKNACLHVTSTMYKLKTKEDRIYYIHRAVAYLQGVEYNIKRPLPNTNK